MNILLITADDMHGRTPACVGGQDGVTPAIDALAEQGMVFGRAHVPVAVCQPSRSAMMTGRWPHLNGAEGFQPVNDDVPLLTELLHGAGYRCGILGKVEHLQPVERFGWDVAVDRVDLGEGRDPALYAARAREFMTSSRQDGRPWFLMANAHDPHRPFSASDEEVTRFSEEQRAAIPTPSRVFTPEEITVPEFLPDLPDVRRELAEYSSSARRCDDVVAVLLSVLQEVGAEEDTLVVFLSDNGMAFPFAKANCYLQSSSTPLVVRWPGVTRPGSREDVRFVSGLDLMPTFCEVAGVPAPAQQDGASLVPLLRGEDEARDRSHVLTVFHETAAKKRYEMRALQEGRWAYVWNAWSDGDRTYRAENMMGRTWKAMTAAAEQDAALARRTDFYLHRAPEELYDLEADPGALVNLAEDPAHAGELARLRGLLSSELRGNGDPLAGALTDLEAAVGAR